MSPFDRASRVVGGLKSAAAALPDQVRSVEELLERAITQSTRLLEMDFSADAGIPRDTLLAHRLTGWEEINAGFRYELQTLSGNAYIPLKDLEGAPIRLAILTASGAKRQIHGVVTQVASEGTDGALATYRLVVEPVTAVLKLTRASRVFLGKSYVDVALQILQEQIRTNPVFGGCFAIVNRCRGRFPVREFIFQNGEDSWTFFSRCLSKEGVSFVFAPAEDASQECPRHCIVLFNDSRDLDENAAGTVRFHRADGTEESDAITRWHARRTLQCGKVTRRTWDHNSGSLGTDTVEVQADQGRSGNALASTLEVYRHETPLEHDAPATSAAGTTTCARSLEQRTKSFSGEGSVRDFRAGTAFVLADHPVHNQDPEPSRTFVLTRVEVEAENNLPAGLEETLARVRKDVPGHGGKPGPVYRNRFACIRLGIPILPEEVPFPPFGYLTATVVGPEGSRAPVHTDEIGRIKVRLHATREEDHPEAGASGTDRDSFWVRLVLPWSSQGVGGTLIPRVGDEVLLSALNHDPDKLVVVGVLPGGTRKPGRFSGVSALPADKAVSGMRSGEFGNAARGNQLLFDDTHGELRAHLSSDHAASELNLGFIAEPRSGGSADPRGEGAELRTDGAAAIRAAKGLLLSAAGRSGPQLAREELAELLEALVSLAESLGEYAGTHLGLSPRLAPAKALQANLKEWETGTNTRPRTQRPPEGQRLLALSAPDGMVAATPRTMAFYTGESLDLASRENGHVTAGQQLVVNAGKGMCLFSHSGALKASAHKDDLDLQAQHGDAALAARNNVKIFATENEILLSAAKKITLLCGGSYLTISEEGVTAGGPAFTGRVGCVSWPGMDTRNLDLPKVAMGPTEGRFRLLFADSAQVAADRPYRIELSDGRIVEGVSDPQGLTDLVVDETLKLMRIEIGAPKLP